MISLRRIVLFGLCVTSSIVSAHITPTVPSAGAQYQGGQTQVFRWSYSKDDMGGNPFLTERFKCDLMWGNSHWVALLARNLSIYDEWVAVYFRPDYGFDSTAYYVRYATEETNAIVDTGRFSLSNMNGTNYNQLFNEQPDLSTASHGSGGSTPDGTNHSVWSTHATLSSGPVPEQVTRVTQTGSLSAPTSTYLSPTNLPSGFIDGSNQSASQTSGPIGPLGTPPNPTLGDTEDSQPISTDNQSSAAGLTRQRDSPWQKVCLALWPVLVGAMMAI